MPGTPTSPPRRLYCTTRRPPPKPYRSEPPTLSRTRAGPPPAFHLASSGSLPPPFALSHVRPSIRPFVHPPAYPLLSASLSFFSLLHALSRAPHLAFSFRPLGPRTDVRSVTRTRAFLFRPLPSRAFPLALANDVRCVRCAALLHLGVRCALCALRAAVPSPARARSLRGLAHRGVRWMTPCTSCRPFIMTITGQRGSSLESG